MRHLTPSLLAAASLTALTVLSALAASPAFAANTLQAGNVGFSCSDVLSLTDEGGFVLGCQGDLKVEGSGDNALLSHGTSITLRASASLTLEDLRIVAPSIVLEAPQIAIGSDVVLGDPAGSGSGLVVLNTAGPLRPPAGVDPNRVTLGGGSLSISPGADLRVSEFRDEGVRWSISPATLPVPEPTSWALMLAGLTGLMSLRARRR